MTRFSTAVRRTLSHLPLVRNTLCTYLLLSCRTRFFPLIRWYSPGSIPKISEANIWKPTVAKSPLMHTCSTGPERAGDWGLSQARLTATPRRTGGRAQPWLGWATHSHSQIRGVAGKEGMRIFIHCQGNPGGNKTASGDDGCVVIEEFQIFLRVGKWKFHIRTFIRFYRLVIILPLSHTIQQDLQTLIHTAQGVKSIFKANSPIDIKSKTIERWYREGKQVTRNLKPEQATVKWVILYLLRKLEFFSSPYLSFSSQLHCTFRIASSVD